MLIMICRMLTMICRMLSMICRMLTMICRMLAMIYRMLTIIWRMLTMICILFSEKNAKSCHGNQISFLHYCHIIVHYTNCRIFEYNIIKLWVGYCKPTSGQARGHPYSVYKFELGTDYRVELIWSVRLACLSIMQYLRNI